MEHMGQSWRLPMYGGVFATLPNQRLNILFREVMVGFEPTTLQFCRLFPWAARAHHQNLGKKPTVSPCWDRDPDDTACSGVKRIRTHTLPDYEGVI